MVKPRRRTDVDPAEEARIAMFAAQAEQPAAAYIKAVPDSIEHEPAPLPQPAPVSAPEPDRPEQADRQDEDDALQPEPSATPKAARRKGSPAKTSVEEAWKRRNREKKSTGLNFRASASQIELLQLAALQEEISQQKVLERLVWPILEERYGKDL